MNCPDDCRCAAVACRGSPLRYNAVLVKCIVHDAVADPEAPFPEEDCRATQPKPYIPPDEEDLDRVALWAESMEVEDDSSGVERNT